MATVNITPQSWNISNATGNLQVAATSSSIAWGVWTSSIVDYAKVWVTIDASKYKSVTLNYGIGTHTDNSSLTFGVFDNTNAMTAYYTQDISGVVAKIAANASSGGSVTLGLDGVDETKYLGFSIWCNTGTSSDGTWSTVGYAEGNKPIISIEAELVGYTLTYDANGGSGAPSSISGIESTTISSTVPTRDGYDFLGWSTYSSATSASYVAGDTITLSDNTTLYAVWVKTYTVTYDANGGSGAISSQTATANSTITLSSNSFTAPTSKVWTLTLDGNGGNDGTPTFNSNYFHKWRAGSTSGTAYSAGDSYQLNGDITMYAWWGTKYIWGTTTRESITNEGYTVTFDENGGTCDTSSLTSIITTSYDFSGWGNSASDPTSTFKSDAIYTQTSDYTAYAIWSSTTVNGDITLPTPTRNGYEFLGWSADPNDTEGATGEYTPTENVVLYAIWKPMGLVYIYDGEFSQYQVWIYDDSGWNQYLPYIYTESGWELYSG